MFKEQIENVLNDLKEVKIKSLAIKDIKYKNTDKVNKEIALDKFKKYGLQSLTLDELFYISSFDNYLINNIIKYIENENNENLEEIIKDKKEEKKYISYLCFYEIIRRYKENNKDKQIKCTSEAIPYFIEYADKEKEHFIILTLDGTNQLIKKHLITIGLINKTMIHPREVFAEAIADRACFIIAAHNHPSGSLDVSKEDIEITKKLKQAGEIIGIKLLDHIIITKEEHKSIFWE